MKIIRLLINTFYSASFNYDARETEIIRGVEVLHLQTYVSLETVGKNSAVFVAHLSKVLWYIYIYYISMKYQNFCLENMISLPRAVNVPLISSHLRIKMTSLSPALAKWRFYFSRRALFYITNVKFDSTLSSEEKFISWQFFMLKLKGLVHGLSYWVFVHSVFFIYILNCIWSRRAIINGKTTWLNFTWF